MRFGHHRQAPLARKVGEQAVGAVEQAVEVEGAGQPEVGRHHQRRGGQRPEPVAGRPPEAAERQAEQGADHRKPEEGGGTGRGGAAQRSEERHGLAESVGRRRGRGCRPREGDRSGGGGRVGLTGGRPTLPGGASGGELHHPAGHDQEAAVGDFGHAAVGLAEPVGEEAADLAHRVDPEADLLRHHDRVARPADQRVDETVDVGPADVVGDPRPEGVEEHDAVQP